MEIQRHFLEQNKPQVTNKTTKYCWDGETPCQYLDNTGGHPICELGVGFSPTKAKGKDTGLYLKGPKCLRALIR